MRNSDTIGGFALLFFAGAYALAASNLRLTSSLGIGPGLFPMSLAGILGFLGVWIVVKSYVNRTRDTLKVQEEAIPYRSLICISIGPIFFALLVEPLGVLPALFIAVFISCMASPAMTIRAALVCTAFLVSFCMLLFGWGLGLPLELFGPWLSFAG